MSNSPHIIGKEEMRVIKSSECVVGNVSTTTVTAYNGEPIIIDMSDKKLPDVVYVPSVWF